MSDTGVLKRGPGATVPGPARAAGGIVRPYLPADRERVLEIIGRVWDERRRGGHAHLWDWKHARDGEQAAGRESLVVEIDGQVVGYSGSIPVRFRIADQEMDGAFTLDTFVDPGARGAGRRLMRAAVDHAVVCVGAGNERARVLWSRLSGRRDLIVRRAAKRACVLDPAPLLEARGMPAPVARTARVMNRALRWGLSRLSRRAPAGVRIERADRFPEDVDRLWAGFGRRFRHLVIRDRRFLEWRFVACPLRYDILLLWRADRLDGYAVHRPAVLNGRKVVLLVEIVADGGRPALDYRLLLARVEAEAWASGACEIETLDPGCPILRRVMRRVGYVRKRQEEPILGYVGQGRAEPADFHDDRVWWLGAGDADFEFIFFNQFDAGHVPGTEHRPSEGA